MNTTVQSLLTDGGIIDFSDYGELVMLLKNSIIAGAILGIVGGLISVFVITRDMPFAVHGISEMSFAGAAGALLFTGNVVAGSFIGAVLAALLLAALGAQTSEYNSILGVLMPFALGLGILFLALYEGRAANKFGLLTGQVVAIDDRDLTTLIVTSAIVLTALIVIWRPLTFASVDPDVATTSGVPVRLLSVLFMVLLACTVAISIQIIGALLVLALLCTPAAAAMQLTSSPLWLPVASMSFALLAMVGGILVALGTTVPVSPYITTISFATYLVCRAIRWRRDRVRRRIATP